MPTMQRIDTDSVPMIYEFARRYDRLVDLLCITAKEGVTGERMDRYRELRSWFVKHYDGIRPTLLPHVETVPEDLAVLDQRAPAPRDAFEALFMPSELEPLIHSENVLQAIIRTRWAVETCRDHMDSVPA